MGSELYNSQRYELVVNTNARADQYLLDTATGMVWNLAADDASGTNKRFVQLPVYGIDHQKLTQFITSEELERAVRK